ncbi:MAG TPA: efflux RND transporter periplasmic adaptor subunit [Gemmatimonadales bacterium]|jgi:multidrug resistance efflux pump
MTRRVVVVAIVVVAAIGAALWVVRHRGPRELTLAGVVDANEVVVTPPVQARIDSLWVDEGATVKAGDRIASLDPSELAAMASSAGAGAAGARAALAEATTSAEQATGEAVADQAAARAKLAADSADVVRQAAELTRLRNDASRTAALAAGGAVSTQQLEQATTAAKVQEQTLAASREMLRSALADVRRADAGAIAARTAESKVVATRAQLHGAQADSAAAGTRLGYTDLTAPVGGVVQVLVARRGELVGPGSPVAVIVDPDHLWVRVAAPETDAGAVAVGDSLTVTFPSGLSVRGSVLSKSAEADFATQHDVSASKRDIRAVAFRVAIPNPRHALVPGMSANVVLPVAKP